VKEAKRRRIATLTIELQKRVIFSAEMFFGGWWTYMQKFGLGSFTIE
jgi:hypothetical protein